MHYTAAHLGKRKAIPSLTPISYYHFFYISLVGQLMRLFTTLLALFTLSACSSLSVQNDKIPTLASYQFAESDHVMQDIDDKLAKAKAEHKKLLLVLGAQWCHDSTGLAAKFSQSTMQTILTEHYQTLFIDVGYYQRGFDVVSRFNMPIYYGTPTVMIIDPESETIINSDSMQQWLSADSISLENYQKYFSRMANENNLIEQPLSPALAKYYQQINEFSSQQAKRLKQAYQVLGPALARYVENKEQFSAENEKVWSQARKLRYNIQNDVIALKEQAKKAVEMQESIELEFPEYDQFSWE
ncbi:thioredoxin family protein [Litorilituus lipolyticus]|uniref:Thioredoxin family protein n=1 Tax=Litorilituus lipolyticus TaxID=2491017 RepID=A0A502KZZ8_9GAMM|nr:thioredoxin family protein [Litorilituus lipolyticus]TPH17290.1 thioredoxin family protein [Litorilituus lipolyticus]